MQIDEERSGNGLYILDARAYAILITYTLLPYKDFAFSTGLFPFFSNTGPRYILEDLGHGIEVFWELNSFSFMHLPAVFLSAG